MRPMQSLLAVLLLGCLAAPSATFSCHAPGEPEPGRPGVNSLGMELVRIPEGIFVRGNDAGGRARWDEQPAQHVTLTRPFLISAEEVTEEQFRAFRPGFRTTSGSEPYAAGVSWHEAVAFCEWLSAREGRPYRLPTEAEWEYACRAGTTSEYSSGDSPHAPGTANAWGLRNMHSGVREWCLDWYAQYPLVGPDPLVDPTGPESGLTKVVRGGLLDDPGRIYDRKVYDGSSCRASMAPAFGPQEDAGGALDDPVSQGSGQGVIGTWFAAEDFTRPQRRDLMARLENNWANDIARGRGWSARWRGVLTGPCSGEVTWLLRAHSGARLKLDGAILLDAWETGQEQRATVSMEEGRPYALELEFARRGTSDCELQVLWSWEERPLLAVQEQYLSWGLRELELARAEGGVSDPGPGQHLIGLRIVQAPMPAARPTPVALPLAWRGVVQDTSFATFGPDPARPYFRKRHLLPTPPDNSSAEEIDAFLWHPSLRGHNHSPALEVLPNGDLLLVIYTSWQEYEPEVSLIAARLRQGADQWDDPTPFLEQAAVNDHAPLLWTDHERGDVYLFWGAPRLVGGYPFQWTVSSDNGASWAPIRFPRFVTGIGSHSRQPINTAFRDRDGVFFLSSDGNGGQSLLWATSDGGLTWQDRGGRTAGRHTSFAVLGDGRTILGLGGKSTDIDGFMPQSLSRDGGRSFEVSPTVFPAQGTNQRPSLLRLRSGRLVFAADFQHFDGRKPQPYAGQSGSFVAFSDDEGATWTLRPLPGAQQHEDPRHHGGAATLGYSAMRQAPNGLIHLVGTMTRPCLHFAFNEAWLEAGPEDPSRLGDEWLMPSQVTSVSDVRRHEERWPDGARRLELHVGIGDDGSLVRHGVERWYHEDGRIERKRHWELGRIVGPGSDYDSQGRSLVGTGWR